MAHIYRSFSGLIPYVLKNKIKSFLTYTTITIDPDSFIGFITVYSLLLGLVSGFFLVSFFRNYASL